MLLRNFTTEPNDEALSRVLSLCSSFVLKSIQANIYRRDWLERIDPEFKFNNEKLDLKFDSPT